MIKIIIVEDEDIIRKGLVHSIDWLSMGCTIIAEAEDGVKGLELIKKYKPELVITDIKMPYMNGIDMIKRANTECIFESIILTSYAEFEYAKEAITMKAFDYILKPIDEKNLMEVVEKAVDYIEQKRIYHNIYVKSKDKTDVELVDLEFYVGRSNDNPYVQKALIQIRDNYFNKISIEKIAEELGVSTSYLSRKFKQETTQTFLDVLNKFRVQKAIELLGKGEFRIYEISDQVGFGEYKNFCKVFKKYTNTTPTEFINAQSYIKLKA